MAKPNFVKQSSRRRNVEYYPPCSEDVKRYTSTVCQELGNKVDPTLNTPEVRQELTDFINVVAAIWSKHLNKQEQQLDKDY